MTIGKKFVLVYSIFLITVLAGAYFVFKATLNQNKDRTVANLAGRQGMLAQKYTKEYINDLVPLQVRNSTLKTAEIVTEQIVQDRNAYTKNIVGKLKQDGVTDVHPNKDYNDISGGIPLPATFVKEVSDTINQRGIYSYDLLSKWNINNEKGLRTDFEKEAFDYLYSQKEEVFYSFMVHDGLYTLRYATTDIAGEACASCHNAHEDSPKHDFKAGDVMGILVVNIPIGSVSDKTEAFFATSDDKDFGVDSFLKTEKVFNATMSALINGGEAPIDFEMTKFTNISPTDNPKILSKLNEVKQLWETIKENLQKLLKAEINSAEYIVAYRDSYDSANATMKAMTEAVDMYTANSEKQSAMLLWFQGGSVFIVCLVIGMGWISFAQPLINFLREFVSTQVKVSGRVALASDQVSSSSHTLAEGATEQAASLEETSSSMEEMTAMTKQNAQNAEEASKLVDACAAAAEDGNKAAAEVSSAMEEITESSKKIAEITKVIDSIASQTNNLAVKAGQDTSQIIKQGNSFAVVAKEVRNLANKSTSAAKDTKAIVDGCIAFVNEFENESDKHKEFRDNIKKIARGIKDIETIAYQTNLLALNAAVEAARASDNGEKFAAVTEEVSSLAKKSATAAKDTTTLINECVQKAGNGTKVASACKETMESIVKDVQRASILTKEITEASAEQSAGINQVTEAVQQMDQVTQQTAASAEETASASEELASQAHTMQEQIDVLARQVSGNSNVELSSDKHSNTTGKKGRQEGKTDKETSSLAPEYQYSSKKTTGSIAFKLLFSPIYILRYTLQNIFNLSSKDVSDIGSKSGPTRGITNIKDSTKTVPGNGKNTEGNGNDKENVLAGTASHDSVIPMGSGKAKEHDSRFEGF